MSKTMDHLNALVLKIADKNLIDSPMALVGEVDIPSFLAAAFLTNRPEMVESCANGRSLDVAETSAVMRLLAVLMQTNQALREHAEGLAIMTDSWLTAFKGIATVGGKIGDFANFRALQTDQDED